MLGPSAVESSEQKLQALEIENGRLKTALTKAQSDLRKAMNLIAHIHWAIKVGAPKE